MKNRIFKFTKYVIVAVTFIGLQIGFQSCKNNKTAIMPSSIIQQEVDVDFYLTNSGIDFHITILKQQ